MQKLMQNFSTSLPPLHYVYCGIISTKLEMRKYCKYPGKSEKIKRKLIEQSCLQSRKLTIMAWKLYSQVSKTRSRTNSHGWESEEINKIANFIQSIVSYVSIICTYSSEYKNKL